MTGPYIHGTRPEAAASDEVHLQANDCKLLAFGGRYRNAELETWGMLNPRDVAGHAKSQDGDQGRDAGNENRVPRDTVGLSSDVPVNFPLAGFLFGKVRPFLINDPLPNDRRFAFTKAPLRKPPFCLSKSQLRASIANRLAVFFLFPRRHPAMLPNWRVESMEVFA